MSVSGKRIIKVALWLILSLAGLRYVTASESQSSRSLPRSHQRKVRGGTLAAVVDQRRRQNDNVIDAASFGTNFRDRDTTVTFKSVVIVAVVNVFINTLRPDPNISFQARIPRVMWELSIACIASLASPKESTSNTSSSAYLLLTFMTAPTALIDIFWWSPMFALFASFRTCRGGGLFSRGPKICERDSVKGFGRLFVSAQSIGTGVFYLLTAITAWTQYVKLRDQDIMQRNALSFERALHVGVDRRTTAPERRIIQ